MALLIRVMGCLWPENSQPQSTAWTGKLERCQSGEGGGGNLKICQDLFCKKKKSHCEIAPFWLSALLYDQSRIETDSEFWIERVMWAYIDTIIGRKQCPTVPMYEAKREWNDFLVFIGFVKSTFPFLRKYNTM